MDESGEVGQREW
jgi:hypothetical protein